MSPLEGLRQFADPPLHAVRLDIRKILTVYSRRALVRAALGITVLPIELPRNLNDT